MTWLLTQYAQHRQLAHHARSCARQVRAHARVAGVAWGHVASIR